MTPYMARSDSFNAGRFRKLLSFELKDSVSEQGLFVLLMGLSPVFMFILAYLYTLTFNGYQTDGFWESYYFMKAFVATIIFVLFFLLYPIRRYGYLTDRKQGAAGILLPASHAEKFTSAVAMSAVIAPAIFLILYLGSDAIISALFRPDRISLTGVLMKQGLVTTSDGSFVLNATFAFFLPPMVSLAGLAGAVMFRKNKATKTFLICSAAVILFFLLLINILDSSKMSHERVAALLDSNFTWFWYSIQSLVTVLAGLYFWKRTETLQL